MMAMSDIVLGAIDIQRILRVLPHRYPFLLVDRVIGLEPGERCIGVKNVTFNEPHFQGHFPNNPIYPGVLILEGMAQAGGVLVLAHRPVEAPPVLVYFLTVDGAKFRRPVGPGDVLHYHMRKTKQRRNMWFFRGEARVGDDIVAEADLGAMIQEQ
jgi:3-hydroxyacyl-[acyl-carrier-protein] dehydratase